MVESNLIENLGITGSPYQVVPAAKFTSFKPGSTNLSYRGTLNSVLTDIEINKRSSHVGSMQRAIQPARIIRAALDYKIAHPELAETAEPLLGEAIHTALEIYNSESNVGTSLEAAKFRAKVVESGLEELLTLPLAQPSDSVTSKASSSERSQKTASKLDADFNTNLPTDKSIIHNDKTYSKDVLFIALGHGGVAAGLDVFSRYCKISGSDDSEFYVARLSMAKKRDKAPRLSETEIARLKELSKDRRIVIFDEDIASGRTVKAARSYFERVFSDQEVKIVANYDARLEFGKLGLGGLYDKINDSNMTYDKKHLFIKEIQNVTCSNNLGSKLSDILSNDMFGDIITDPTEGYFMKKPSSSNEPDGGFASLLDQHIKKEGLLKEFEEDPFEYLKNYISGKEKNDDDFYGLFKK